MKKTKQTKKYIKLAITFQVISYLATFLPFIVYIIMGFIEGEPHEKFTLGCTIIVSLALVVINVMMKIHLRSTMWILLLGLYNCMDNILPLLLVIAITTILDELVLTPLAQHYRQLATINKQIDIRQT